MHSNAKGDVKHGNGATAKNQNRGIAGVNVPVIKNSIFLLIILHLQVKSSSSIPTVSLKRYAEDWGDEAKRHRSQQQTANNDHDEHSIAAGRDSTQAVNLIKKNKALNLNLYFRIFQILSWA